ncbi:TELO2-interacting protein 2-like isoform X1 [Lycorma delicatula]|uniref:TELO2-interacting protein 2-like isoform X1 n=1 Tax=Lycorma delicatula TaxID=130591 RepID=UPI003F511A74
MEGQLDNCKDSFSESDNDDNEKVWENILLIIEKTYVKKVNIGLERPVEETDFVEQKAILIKNFNLLYKLLCKNFNDSGSGKFFNLKKTLIHNVTVNLLLLCGEHLQNDKSEWTTSDTVKYSQLIIEFMCKTYSCQNIIELLNDSNNNKLLPLLFNKLKPKLLKDTWKCFPAAVSSYTWIVFKIKFPNMGPVLHLGMPTTLILLDDYVIANRINGLNCLHHIIENVTKTELSWYCEGEILYKTLEPMMYSLEPNLLNSLINCLITVLSKIVSNEDKLKWTHYDDVMNIWLPSIEMEQKLAFRSAHMESLSVFLQSMGLSCVRWSKRLIRIFDEYAAIPIDRENCFKVMYTFISVTWPRTSNYFDEITIIILKSLSDVIEDKDSNSDNLNSNTVVNSIVECLNILNDIVPDEMQKLSCDINNCESLSDLFKSFFKSKHSS